MLTNMPKKSSQKELIAVIADNIRYGRLMSRWSQEELAEKSKLHRTRVGSLERATAAATVDSIGAIAKAFRVAPYVLLMPPAEAQPIILAAISADKK